MVRDGRETAWHLYVLRLHPERLAIDRDAVVDALAKRGIGVSVHFIPLHLQTYWRDAYGLRPEDFPVAGREWARALSLPIYSAMTDRDVGLVIGAVTDLIASSRHAP